MARRSGGRAARQAKRAAPPSAEARAIWPGMIGGDYRPLSDRDIDAVVDASLGLLEDLGMGQTTPEFVELVSAAGGWVDEHERLRFPRDLVLSCIETAAKEFLLHGFNQDEGIHIGGQRVHFATGGAAVMILDHETCLLYTSPSPRDS